jgi:hypothetical protein
MMKGYATFFLIAVMSLGLVFLLATRSRTAHDAPAEVVDLAPGADAGDGGLDGGVDAANDAAMEASAPRPVERPLRVVALGWELIAAGVELAGVDGGTAAGLELGPEVSLDAVEARLARGGADPVGADVAILPLPAFVQAYDRLRALEPRAFAVVGFSRGREEVHAASGALLKAPPAGEEVKLVALGPSTAESTAAKASGSESATLLGLFALDLLGVPGARVRMLGPGADGKGAQLSALVRGAADERKLAFSTADASRLIPVVMVAPRAQLEASEPKLRELARTWLSALTRSQRDAATVARRLANKEALPLAAGVGGAPEAVALLDRLGQLEPVGVSEQRALLGPLAKGPGGLESLVQRTWLLARAGGLTSSAAPSPLPIDARIALAIAPAPAAAPLGAADAGAPDAGGALPPLPASATPLCLYRAVDPASDVASVAAQIGFLAAVFERAAFRVSAKGGDKVARSIAAAARDGSGIAQARLATTAQEPAGAFASVEILSLP